jgi:thymidine phosphorylase
MAEELARSLMRVGRGAGVTTHSLITDMTQPLGRMVGNACEVDESIEVLQGGGPAEVRELTIELATRVLLSTALETDLDVARLRLERLLDSGAAMERFERMVVFQGGDLSATRHIAAEAPVLAGESGYVASIDGQLLGQAVIAMGGGRKIAGESIQFSVGLKMACKVGSWVDKSQPLLFLLCDDPTKKSEALLLVEQAIQIRDDQQPFVPLWRDLL